MRYLLIQRRLGRYATDPSYRRGEVEVLVRGDDGETTVISNAALSQSLVRNEISVDTTTITIFTTNLSYRRGNVEVLMPRTVDLYR